MSYFGKTDKQINTLNVNISFNWRLISQFSCSGRMWLRYLPLTDVAHWRQGHMKEQRYNCVWLMVVRRGQASICPPPTPWGLENKICQEEIKYTNINIQIYLCFTIGSHNSGVIHKSILELYEHKFLSKFSGSLPPSSW
jgi:hypothetical protein